MKETETVTIRRTLLTRPLDLLRVEGGVLFILTILLYGQRGGSWLLFALLLLAPDASMAGYLAGSRVGAICYNAVHAYLLPAALATYGVLGAYPIAVSLALIWFAHIGVDRLLGYGLKYPSGFKDTHLKELATDSG